MAAFKKQELQELQEHGETDRLKVVKDTIVGKRRWSIDHWLAFLEKASGKHFRVPYSVGATEQQDESPFEYADELVEALEVRPVERAVVVYELVR